ncbi:unnamed protein product [marine sediment metagenome]|uniref:DUF4355 domain-containing protein n=1 Tax=marine sediment metagenome TaxID=412755 RepID=X0ZFF2_9ZZZZ
MDKIQEVKEFFDKNKDTEDVKTYLKELKLVTSKEAETYLETDDGKKLLQPKLDSHFSKSLETWKENNLAKEFETKLADEIAIRYPDETEEQKRIKALEKSQAESDLKLANSELKNTAITFLTKEELPLDLTDYLVGKDESKTVEKLGKFKTMMDIFQKKITEELYKKHGREPKEGPEEATPLETLEKQYDEAMASGNMLTAAVKSYSLDVGNTKFVVCFPPVNPPIMERKGVFVGLAENNSPT